MRLTKRSSMLARHRSRVFIHEGWTHERGGRVFDAGERSPGLEFARSLVGTWRLEAEGRGIHLTGIDDPDVGWTESSQTNPVLPLCWLESSSAAGSLRIYMSGAPDAERSNTSSSSVSGT